MELTLADTPVTEPSAKPKGKRNVRNPRPRLLTPAGLDHRTNAAKAMAALTADVEEELGRQLGVTERNYVDAFCGTVLLVQNLNARLVRGEPINFSEHTQACQTMLSFASLLGLKSNKQLNGGANK
jgi:hypothetical protein